MASLTSNASCNPSSISVRGKNTSTGTISWSALSIPSGAIINSCTLTGSASSFTTGGKGATLTINGTSVNSGSSFTINLGTDASKTSVTASFVGAHNQTNTSVTLSNLVYTVSYTIAEIFTVTFVDYDGTILSTQSVQEGSSATAPSNPTRDGYTFIGWDTDFSNITSNLTITAQYEEIVVVLNDFPPFTDAGWYLDADATNTLTETYSYGFNTATTTGWIGYYIPVPEDWYGKIVDLKIESITPNASLVIQTSDTFEEIFALNSTKLEASARITAGRSYIIFLRTDYLGTGDVLVTGVSATVQGEIPKLTSLELNTESINIGLNLAGTVRCNISPVDAQYNFVWSVDNPIVSIGQNGLLCNILGSAIGTCTLTVTDTLTGLTDSCLINVIENSTENENIFPPFNIPNTWYLDLTCDLTEMNAYDCVFNTPATWTGISISIPESWWGRKVEIKCDSIGENSGFYIQEADTWSELGILNSTTTSIEIDFPPIGTYSDIKLALQNPALAGEVSMTGAFARYTDLPIYVEPTWVEFENRVVGYKAAEIESPVENATLCDNIESFIAALSAAKAGDTIYLRQGIYTSDSTINISVQGSANGYITIKGYPGETVVFTGTPLNFATGTRYVNFENIIVADLYDLHWGSAIRVSGGTSYINIRNIEIYNINCQEIVGEETSGCNPLVIYADTSGAISYINVENCYIHDCDTGWSEALTLNGNVSNCLIKNCTIKDITNIGIDLAGNYEWTGTVGDPNNQTHDCIVENCLIMNCQSPYATSAGLYSDGARDNIFRYNVIYNCQCGIELGSEQSGSVSENFIIHNNLIIDSGRCIGIGAYLETGAQNRNAYIYNNTFVCGDNNKENYGLYVERTDNVNFYNNIIYGTANTKLYVNHYNSVVNAGNNCWYQPSGEKPEIDTTGIFADPLFVNNDLTINGNYTLFANSPCINAGVNTSTNYIGDTDLNGNVRTCDAVVDIGSFENQDTSIYTVTFKDWDETILSIQEVVSGSSAVAPPNPIREGYIFVGWDVDFNNVISNLNVTAVYQEESDTPSSSLSIYLGSIDASNIYMGDIIVEKIYIGEYLIK